MMQDTVVTVPNKDQLPENKSDLPGHLAELQSLLGDERTGTAVLLRRIQGILGLREQLSCFRKLKDQYSASFPDSIGTMNLSSKVERAILGAILIEAVWKGVCEKWLSDPYQIGLLDPIDGNSYWSLDSILDSLKRSYSYQSALGKLRARYAVTFNTWVVEEFTTIESGDQESKLFGMYTRVNELYRELALRDRSGVVPFENIQDAISLGFGAQASLSIPMTGNLPIHLLRKNRCNESDFDSASYSAYSEISSISKTHDFLSLAFTEGLKEDSIPDANRALMAYSDSNFELSEDGLSNLVYGFSDRVIRRAIRILMEFSDRIETRDESDPGSKIITTCPSLYATGALSLTDINFPIQKLSRYQSVHWESFLWLQNGVRKIIFENLPDFQGHKIFN